MNSSRLISPTLFAKFVSTNLIGTVVDTLVLWGLATFMFDSYLERYVVAPSVSFEVAVVNNFTLSYFWIWEDRVERTAPDFIRRFAFYNLNALLVFLLKLLLLVVISMLLPLHVVYCNLMALTVTGLVNFFTQDRLIFQKQKRPDS